MSPPGSIDGLQFARDMGELRGKLEMVSLPRLGPLNCRTEGIDFLVCGGRNSQGNPSLKISASGRLGLICQRCLEPMTWDVAVDVELELCADVALIASADDDVDRVLTGPAMNVAELVEDELLLEISTAPKHESCTMGLAAPVADSQVSQISPFSVLRGLNGKSNSG